MNLSIIKQLAIALALGVGTTLFLVQHDTWIKNRLCRFAQEYVHQTYNADVTCTVQSINMLTGTVEFAHVTLQPCDEESWHWNCAKLTATFSWPTLLLYGMIDLKIVIDHLEATSDYRDGKLAIIDHIKKLLFGQVQVLPIAVKSVALNNSSLTVVDETTCSSAKIFWSSEIQSLDNALHSTFYLNAGEFFVQNQPLFSNLSGTIDLDVAYHVTGPDITVKTTCKLATQLIPEDSICFLNGQWKNNKGNFTMANASKSLHISNIEVVHAPNDNRVKLDAQFPLAAITKFFPELAHSNINGSGSVKMFGSFDQGYLTGQVQCINITTDLIPLPISDCLVTFTLQNKKWYGSLSAITQNVQFCGAWSLDDQMHRGQFVLSNKTDLRIPETEWWLPAHNTAIALTADFSPDKKLALSAKYKAEAFHTNNAHCLQGEFLYDQGGLETKGRVNNHHFHISYATQQPAHIEKIIFTDELGRPILNICAHKNNQEQLVGSIFIDPFKELLAKAGYRVQGDGTVSVAANARDDYATWQVTLKPESSLRIPHLYNCLTGMQASIKVDPRQKKIIASDITCALSKGSATCPQAVALFDNKCRLIFAHCPLTVNDCLFNWHKDFFTHASGHLLIGKQLNQPATVTGNIILEHAYLVHHVAQPDTNQLIDSPNNSAEIFWNISVATKNPMRIKTDSFDAYASLNATMQNTLQDPIAAGSLTFLDGKLSFPYKDLLVTKGMIYLLPGQEPMIELMANNVVKKYNVTLNVTGPLSNQKITVESAPPLTNEQIFSLLIVGTEQESLSSLMPALVMNNVKDIIFGSKPFFFVEHYLQRFMKPLHNVHLVPIFSDPNGQGLQAKLEVEIGSRWRAMAQKKLHSAEQPHAEFECALADELCLRGIKSVNGDLRGEVELRWKWG